MTVFIKRYPSKGELPKNSSIYNTNIGELKYYSGTSDWTIVNKTKLDGGDDRLPKYWLEEIEIPSEEDVNNKSLGWVMCSRQECFVIGANFIINHLK